MGAKRSEVLGRQKLRDDLAAVVGRVGCVVRDGAVVVDEPHEAGVLDPVTLRRTGGDEHPFVDGRFLGEGDLVVVGGYPGEPADRLSCRFPAENVAIEPGHRLVQRRLVEPGAETVENKVRGLVVGAQLGELGAEGVSFVHGGLRPPRDEQASRLVDPDLEIAADDPGAELEAGHVSFPDGPGAQHEAELARAEAALVGVLHDRGVREGSTLRGLFVGEVGADQKAPVG